MNKKMIHRVCSAGLLLSGLLAGTGCSIKEDRRPCPAYLNVSFRDREHIDREVGLLGYGPEEIFREEIDVSRHVPYWVKAVRKGVFHLSAYIGADRAAVSGHYLTLPAGQECDSLYAYHTEIEATDDMIYTEVVLHKQFCTVHLDILKPATGAEGIGNYRFLIEGGTCGFDLLDFEPVPGLFRFEPKPAEGARIVDFRIPRQGDGSLSLDLWFRPGDGTEVRMGRFPIGEYILRQGYNWKAEDLQDIYVMIDTIHGLVTVSVADWEKGTAFPFIEQ